MRLDRPPNTPNNGTILAKMRAALLDEDDARLKAARMAQELLTYLGSLLPLTAPLTALPQGV
jgi:hypothetical protein